MDFNSNSPAVRGMEWRPSSSRELLLDATTKGVAMRFKGNAASAYTHLHRFLSAVQGSPGLGIEILTQLVPDGAGSFGAFPNEDVSIGSWTEDDGTTTTIYDQINETSLDTATYIKTATYLSTYDFRVGIGSGNLAGKRVSAINMNTTMAVTSGVLNVNQALVLSGVAHTQTATISTTPNVYTKQWKGNPSTSKPWTIAESELLDTTDEERFVRNGAGSAELRVYQSYTTFDYYTENRLGFAYTTGAPTLNWFEENISDATLSANTYYYVHLFPLAGSAPNYFKVPLLKDPNVVMAADATSSTGEHRVAYETTLDGANGIILSATELPGEMLPILFDRGGTIDSQSNPYCELD